MDNNGNGRNIGVEGEQKRPVF